MEGALPATYPKVHGALRGKSVTTAQKDLGPFSTPYQPYATPGKFSYAFRLVFSSLQMGVTSLPRWVPTVAMEPPVRPVRLFSRKGPPSHPERES